MAAIQRDDQRKVDEIWEDMHGLPPMIPAGEFAHCPEYKSPAEKARFNAAGYINCGPSRAPYRDLPDEWRKLAEVHGRAWTKLRRKYSGV
jgi:hypothetical protein